MPTLTIKGTTFAYDDAGTGAPPMLFVHGWGGNKGHFAAQMAHFATTNRAVAVDRRGHGASDAPVQEYTITEAADDLACISRELGLDRAVVVQHSMDAVTIDFAARYPELVLAVCILDGPTLAGPAFDEGATQFLAGLESDHWQAAIRGFADQLVFPADTPDEVKDAALGELMTTPRHVLVSSWRHFVGYASEASLRQIRCPLLYVAGTFPADLDRLRKACPQAQTAEVRGYGHFIQANAADPVNKLLAGFVQEVTAAVA